MGYIVNDDGSWNCLCGSSSIETSHCGGCGRSKASAIDQLKREKASAGPVEMADDERLAIALDDAMNEAWGSKPEGFVHKPAPYRKRCMEALAKARDLLGVDKLKAELAQAKADHLRRYADAQDATKRAEEAEARMRVAPQVAAVDDDELARKISWHVTNGNDDWNTLSPMQRTRFRDAAKEVRLLIQSSAPVDAVHEAIVRATHIYGDTGDGLFNLACFSKAMMDKAGLRGVVDGQLCRVILTGRSDVKQTAANADYWRLLSAGQVTAPAAPAECKPATIGPAMAAVESLAQVEVERHSRARAVAQNADAFKRSLEKQHGCEPGSLDGAEPTRYPTPALDRIDRGRPVVPSNTTCGDDGEMEPDENGAFIVRRLALSAAQSDIAVAVKQAQDAYEDACDRKDKRIAELEAKLGKTSSTWTAKAEKDLADLSAIIDPEMEHMGPLAEVLRKKLADLEAQVTELGFLQTRKDYEARIKELEAEVKRQTGVAQSWLGYARDVAHALGSCHCSDSGCHPADLPVVLDRVRELTKIEEDAILRKAPTTHAFVPSAETVKAARKVVGLLNNEVDMCCDECRRAHLSEAWDAWEEACVRDLATQAAGKGD